MSALELWTSKDLNQLLSTAADQIKTSSLNESASNLLIESLKTKLTFIEDMLAQPNRTQQCRTFYYYCCQPGHQLYGTTPPVSVMYQVLNLTILDALVDSCRDDTDVGCVQAPAAADLGAEAHRLKETKTYKKTQMSSSTNKFIAKLKNLASSPQPLANAVLEELDELGQPIKNNDPIMNEIGSMIKLHTDKSQSHELADVIFKLAALVRAYLRVSGSSQPEFGS